MNVILKWARREVMAGRCQRISVPSVGRVWRAEDGRLITEEFKK